MRKKKRLCDAVERSRTSYAQTFWKISYSHSTSINSRWSWSCWQPHAQWFFLASRLSISQLHSHLIARWSRMGKNSRQSRDADRPRSLCRTTNERDERMFMALIRAAGLYGYIRPFNTHDHYANERIMRLWSRGAFLTLHNLDSTRENLLLIIRNCVAFFRMYLYLTIGIF